MGLLPIQVLVIINHPHSRPLELCSGKSRKEKVTREHERVADAQREPGQRGDVNFTKTKHDTEIGEKKKN